MKLGFWFLIVSHITSRVFFRIRLADTPNYKILHLVQDKLFPLKKISPGKDPNWKKTIQANTLIYLQKYVCQLQE